MGGVKKNKKVGQAQLLNYLYWLWASKPKSFDWISTSSILRFLKALSNNTSWAFEESLFWTFEPLILH